MSVKNVNSVYEIAMPEFESSTIKSLIKCSKNILEYGSGGSTIYAVANNKNIVTTETDKQYLDDLLDFCNSELVTGLYCNVGKTEGWGYATSLAQNFSGIKKYAMPPWEIKTDYDLVIIDGRFRVLSFMLSWNNALPGTTIFWDDFESREYYKEVLDYLPKRTVIGRASIWKKGGEFCFSDTIIKKYNKDQR